MFEIKPLSVHQKMYRFREHFESLEELLRKFYESHLEKTKSGRTVEDLMAINASIEVPKRISLILGDCFQNLRSSLDYLVWELVKANKQEPGMHNMFPICSKKTNYKKALEAGRLKGVPDEAAALIDELQPFHYPFEQRKRHMLSVLDELTNINKHRHIIGTFVENRLLPGDLPPRFYVESTIYKERPNGVFERGRILSYIGFQDSSVKSIEIASGIDALSRFLVEEVFSRFQKFFE